MDQQFTIIDLVCCHVNNFIDVCFIMVLYGENAFWAAKESFYFEAPGQNWREDWAVPNSAQPKRQNNTLVNIVLQNHR